MRYDKTGWPRLSVWTGLNMRYDKTGWPRLSVNSFVHENFTNLID
jgi:hypothetical protein